MLLLYSQVFPISNFFTAQCLDVRFWDFLHFICLKLNLQYWYLLLGRKRMCWFVFVFNKGREETFAGSLQNRKSCLSLFRPRKLISVWVLRFYTRCKMHITPVLLKNYSFHSFHLKKCLCHIYVYVIALTWTVHLTCLRICWSLS